MLMATREPSIHGLNDDPPPVVTYAEASELLKASAILDAAGQRIEARRYAEQ